MKPGSQRQPVVDVAAAELDGFVASGPTADDVSRTYDGRLLDTKEKVLAFLAEIESTEASEHHPSVG